MVKRQPAYILKLTGWQVPIAGLVFVAALIISLIHSDLVLDFGDENRLDLIYLQNGFMGPEKQPDNPSNLTNDLSYRWTGRVATIGLPWPLVSVPLKGTLHAAAPRPNRTPGSPDPTLTIKRISGKVQQNLDSFPSGIPAEGVDVGFQVPRQLKPDPVMEQLSFESSDTFQPGKGDSRNLAVIFYNLKLQPDYASFNLLNWLTILLRPAIWALLSLAVWGLAGFFTSKVSWRAGIQTAVGLVLLMGLVIWPVAIEPFYAPWTLILLASWGCLELGSRLTNRAKSLPAPFVYIAAFFPVLPLAQFALGRLDTETHFIGFMTLLVFGAALIISLIAYLKAPSRFETVFIGAFLLAAAIPFLYSHLQLYSSQVKLGGDFRVNYLRMWFVENEGQPLYNLKEIVEYPASAVHMPPAFTVPFWPLLRLFGKDATPAVIAWQVVNDLLLIPIFFILNELFGKVKAGLKLWPAILFLILSSGQVLETLSYGQQNILILFFLCLTALLVKQHRDLLAGVALSFPAFLKLLPGVVALFFLFQRQKKGITGLLIGSVVVNLATIAVVGVDNSWFYFSRAMFGLEEPELGNSNQSWWGFIGRLGVKEVHGSFNPHTYPTQLAPLGYLFALAVLAVCALSVWHSRKGDWLISQLSFGFLMLAAIIISPITWEHYIVMGMVGITAMLVFLSTRPVERWQVVLFAVACCALWYGSKGDLLPEDASGLGLFGSSYRFLATFALWILSVTLLWQKAPVQPDKLDKQKSLAVAQ